MSRFLIDTSCIIAHVSAWHDHHEAAFGEIERRVNRGDDLVVAGHSIIESYSVLTRLPPSRRLSPTAARRILEENFESAEIVALDVDQYRWLVRTAPDRGIAGGGIYDAVIFACARAARADALLTFNERQFRALDDGQIEIVVPRPPTPD